MTIPDSFWTALTNTITVTNTFLTLLGVLISLYWLSRIVKVVTETLRPKPAPTYVNYKNCVIKQPFNPDLPDEEGR